MRGSAWDFVAAPPRSAPGVASMVGYRALDVAESVHRGLPSPWLTFIVSLDDGVQSAPAAADARAARPVPVLLSGLQDRASHVRQFTGQAGIQLAVHPLASRALFGVPSAELSPDGFDAAALLGRPVTRLRAQVLDSGDWMPVLSDYLIRASRSHDDSRVRPEVRHAWHLLMRSRGRIGVAALADRVGLTSRHLDTLFRREVGRGPKAVATLIRFEHATTLIAAAARRDDRPAPAGMARPDGRLSLAGVAAVAGFSDQAHLGREFVRFAGLPPRAWLAEEFRNIQDGGHGGWAEYDHDRSEPQRLALPAGP